MSEIWGPPFIFSIEKEYRKIYLHRTKKNNATWTYYTNDYQYPFIIMVKIPTFINSPYLETMDSCKYSMESISSFDLGYDILLPVTTL